MRQRIKKNKFDDIPAPFYEKEHDRFKELFWLDKGMWTLKRYKELREECIARGFKVENYASNWMVYNDESSRRFFNDFEPTIIHYNLLENRIMTRMKEMKAIRYYGKDISFGDFRENIWNSQKDVLPLKYEYDK